MKKTLVVGLAIGMVTLATSAFAARALFDVPNQGNSYTSRTGATGWVQKNIGGDGIVGSSHDMSGVGTLATGNSNTPQNGATYTAEYTAPGADRQDRICVYCHHPHNTIKGTATQYSPLWNRDLQTTTYTGYNNGNMMSGVGVTASQHKINADATGIKGVSLLCMSCHDGTIAMNAYSQTTGIQGALQGAGSNDPGSRLGTGVSIASKAGFGTDLSNHHPMGFAYDEVAGVGAGQDNEIALSTAIMVPAGITAGGITAGTFTDGVRIADLLNGTGATATMECVTCHDVHNTANAPNAERFLWRSNNQSNFCLVCHLK
jgi:hypothetical protein